MAPGPDGCHADWVNTRALTVTAVTACALGLVAGQAPAVAADGDRSRTERRAAAEGRVVHNALQESWAERESYPGRLTERFWARSSDRPASDVVVRGYVLREDDTYRYCVVHRDGGWATYDLRDDRDARIPGFVASGESGDCRWPDAPEREPDLVDVALAAVGLD